MDGSIGGVDSFASEVAPPKVDIVVNAEVGLLSAVLSDFDGSGEALGRVAGKVPVEDFADPRRAAIWSAILARYGRHETVDAASVSEALAAAREPIALKHLSELRQVYTAPRMADEHADKVRAHGYRRRYAAAKS